MDERNDKIIPFSNADMPALHFATDAHEPPPDTMGEGPVRDSHGRYSYPAQAGIFEADAEPGAKK